MEHAGKLSDELIKNKYTYICISQSKQIYIPTLVVYSLINEINHNRNGNMQFRYI